MQDALHEILVLEGLVGEMSLGGSLQEEAGDVQGSNLMLYHVGLPQCGDDCGIG